jgi:glutathione S-transferase
MLIYPALVTALAMILFAVTIRMVGVARGRYKIAPPATTGHPDFDRYYRVQMNTLEQLVFFLPSLWLFAVFLSPLWAALLGLIWLIGRVLFARGYYAATSKRVLGFIITIASSSVLLLGGIVGIVMELLAQNAA